jgi:serine/threonine protein kinase
VALKVIRAEHRLDEETKARFLREARILSQLEHPHICRIYDLIEQTDADMLVLELVNGKSLREAIRAGLDPMQRMTIARQILDVLTVAHAKAIIHRDLKPDNIMIDLNGDVKILDFGLARSIEELSETLSLQPSSSPVDRGEAVPEPSIRISVSDQLTQLGSVVGTLSYMSPEQARGETVTTACDMYSCGLLLQEIFTGRPAYESGIDRALWRGTQSGSAESMLTLLRSLSASNLPPRPSGLRLVTRSTGWNGYALSQSASASGRS